MSRSDRSTKKSPCHWLMLLPMLAPEIMMSIRATIKPENGIDDMIWFTPYDGRSPSLLPSSIVVCFFAACVYGVCESPLLSLFKIHDVYTCGSSGRSSDGEYFAAIALCVCV